MRHSLCRLFLVNTFPASSSSCVPSSSSSSWVSALFCGRSRTNHRMDRQKQAEGESRENTTWVECQARRSSSTTTQTNQTISLSKTDHMWVFVLRRKSSLFVLTFRSTADSTAKRTRENTRCCLVLWEEMITVSCLTHRSSSRDKSSSHVWHEFVLFLPLIPIVSCFFSLRKKTSDSLSSQSLSLSLSLLLLCLSLSGSSLVPLTASFISLLMSFICLASSQLSLMHEESHYFLCPCPEVVSLLFPEQQDFFFAATLSTLHHQVYVLYMLCWVCCACHSPVFSIYSLDKWWVAQMKERNTSDRNEGKNPIIDCY